MFFDIEAFLRFTEHITYQTIELDLIFPLLNSIMVTNPIHNE